MASRKAKEKQMLKRFMTVTIALIVAASLSVTALAAPANIRSDNSQLKPIRTEITKLHKELTAEKKVDHKLTVEINKLKKLIVIDKAQLVAYLAELKSLNDLRKPLVKELCNAIAIKDLPKVASIKLSIQALKVQITALKLKYPNVVKVLRANYHFYCDGKVFSEILIPKYTALKLLTTECASQFSKLNPLYLKYKSAVKAADTTNSAAILGEIKAQTALVKGNLAKHLEMMSEITKILKDCKVYVR